MSLSLFACGSNGSSQLSLNHSQDVHTLHACIVHPSVPVHPDSEIVDLVSASTHSLLLLKTGVKNLLLGAGTNTLGQLGPRCALWDEIKPEGRFKPVDLVRSAGIEGDWNPVKIAVTWTTTFVVYQKLPPPQEIGGSGTSGDEGTEQILLACGSNDFGELGFSSGVEDRIPVTRSSDKPTGVDLGLSKGETVKMIRGGQRHVVVVIRGISGDERIVGWGAARKGELHPTSNTSSSARPTVSKGKGKGKLQSHPTTLPPTVINLDHPSDSRILDVVLGASHTLVLLSTGRVLAWGSNAKSQISGLDQLSDVVGIAVTWGGSYFLTAAGEIWSQGSNTHGQLLRPGNGTASGRMLLEEDIAVERIVAGSEHVLVVGSKRGEKGLWVGGWNEHGNLGLGDTAERSAPTQLDLDGELKGVWGGLAATWVWKT